MEKNKLTVIEEAKVEYFINAYNELHRALDLVNSDISMLQKEQVEISKKIDLVRAQDKEFLVELENKYGVGTIEVETLSYIVDNET